MISAAKPNTTIVLASITALANITATIPRVAVGYATLLATWILAGPAAQAQRNLTDIPEPNPAAELAAMQVAEGFEVNLFASDPDISKPIHMNWDAQGRLWVATSNNYPQLQPGAEPTDRLIVLEDTNGDGVADRREVFADDLMIPTGVLPGDGGVYVANSTQLIHLADTDSDGKADKRRTILSGFGTEDTHHLLHTLRWRPDGRMAMNQSIYIHSHIETPYGVRRLDGGGIWHFDPYTSQLDVFCKGFVNPWGHAITPFGQSLVTDGAYFEGINYTFPGAVFATSPGATRWLSGLNPGSPKHCGLEIISGSAMPEELQGVLVTNDFRGHRVCMFRVEREGSGFRSEQLPELIRSEHIAFRPIDVKMGPDGAIYIADWYNPIIQHGEVDFRDSRRDTEHGRIWRISAKSRPATPRPDYKNLDEAGLAELLASSALWKRQFAREELSKRPADAVDAALTDVATVQKLSRDASFALQPLWLQLSQHRLAPETARGLAEHNDPRVRAAAVRVIGEHAEQWSRAAEWLSEASQDEDAQVALEAVCGLQHIPAVDSVQAILAVAERPSKDQYLRFAIWDALGTLESVWLPALEDGSLEVADLPHLEALADAAKSPAVARLLAGRLPNESQERQPRLVELIASTGDADALETAARWIIEQHSQTQPSTAADMLRSLVAQSAARQVTPSNVTTWLPQAISEHHWTAAESTQLAQAMLEAAATWKVKPASSTAEQWLAEAIASDQTELAAAAMNSLARLGTPEGRSQVRQLASDEAMPASIRAAAIAALSSFNTDAATTQLIRALQSSHGNPQNSAADAAARAESTAVWASACDAILASKNGAESLRKSLATTQPSDWDADSARLLLASVRSSSQNSPALEQSVLGSTGLQAAGWKLSSELSERILNLVDQHGDPARGQAIYRRTALQCVACHAIGESGIAIGPNLVSLGASSTADYVLESLLEPSAKVKEGFQTLSILLDTDEILNGLQKSRTDEVLTVQLADGSIRSIAEESILSIKDGNSLMPGGLLDQLPEQDLVDLVAFLTRLGKEAAFTVDTKNWVRNWEVLRWTPEANSRLNRSSMDTAATDDPALQWMQLSSTVDGSLPLSEAPEFQPHRQTPKTVFARFDVECKQAGLVQMRFTADTSAVSVWLDGKPIPTPGADELLNLAAGDHRVVLGIRTAAAGSHLGCEVVGAGTDPAIFDLR